MAQGLIALTAFQGTQGWFPVPIWWLKVSERTRHACGTQTCMQEKCPCTNITVRECKRWCLCAKLENDRCRKAVLQSLMLKRVYKISTSFCTTQAFRLARLQLRMLCYLITVKEPVHFYHPTCFSYSPPNSRHLPYLKGCVRLKTWVDSENTCCSCRGPWGQLPAPM